MSYPTRLSRENRTEIEFMWRDFKYPIVRACEDGGVFNWTIQSKGSECQLKKRKMRKDTKAVGLKFLQSNSLLKSPFRTARKYNLRISFTAGKVAQIPALLSDSFCSELRSGIRLLTPFFIYIFVWLQERGQ
jgi:hypothetical protein